jgi:hypothetical protein
MINKNKNLFVFFFLFFLNFLFAAYNQETLLNEIKYNVEFVYIENSFPKI